MITTKDVHVTHSRGTPTETKALRGIDLNIAAGEFVTVIGSNGAGKTTLLSVLAGDIPPDHGSIAFNGDDVTRSPTESRAHLVARVFQDPLAGTCGNLTIAENLALALSRGQRRRPRLALSKGLREEFRHKLAELELGLESRLKERVALLSGGQRQALSLLMATLAPTKILLLDEHTASLDPKTATFVLDLTCKIVNEHSLTALMVTHSMQQALDVGCRTVMLHEGRIVFDVAHDERANLRVGDLLELFKKSCGSELADDSLLSSA